MAVGRGKLESYRRKRDFGVTPEPPPRSRRRGGKAPRYVVQEHSARRLHWDLRLERDGVAVSWAVPNGIPLDPKENRMAVHTEDHPLSYMEFEGEIPAGEYGAGSVRIWDRGNYQCEKWEDAKVMVRFEGERLSGRYALFRTGRGEKDWMIHRIDPPAEPREPFPEAVVPMRPRPGELPAGERGWAAELLWDGVRVLAHCRPGRIELRDGTLRPVDSLYPEVRPLARQLGAREAVLDGELVAFGEDGTPSPGRLAKRGEPASASAVRRRASSNPVTYVIYDLLFLDGRDLFGETYERRRQLLDGLELSGDAWQTPAHATGEAAELLAAARERGLPGIVVKRLDSAYEPGRRSAAWLAIAAREGEGADGGGTRPRTARMSATDWYAAIDPVLRPHLHGRDRERQGSELRVSLAPTEAPERPVALVFDLVPGAPAGRLECCQVAVWLRGMLERLGLRSYAKTSGAKGLQLQVPLNTEAGAEEAKAFARSVAETVAAKFGELVVAGAGEKRRGKVLIEWRGNEAGATTLSAYSLCSGRPRTVSTPLEWREIEEALEAAGPDRLAFAPADVLARVEERGDLFAPLLSARQRLP